MKRYLHPFLLVLLLVASAGYAEAFDPTGHYRVRGWDPGADRSGPAGYTGDAVVAAHGDGYVFQSLFSDQDYSGVGIYDSRAGLFALQYQNSDGTETGVTLLRLVDGRLEGTFIPFGQDGRDGWEVWERE